MGLGAGHDFGLGRLDDSGGNDSYAASGLGLGAGSAGGIGIFWDHLGRDSYATSEESVMGYARGDTGGRRGANFLTLGVFLDTGGRDDTYPAGRLPAANNSVWLPSATEWDKGVGLDQ